MLESEIKNELKLTLPKKLDCPPYIYHSTNLSTNRLFGAYFARYSFELLPGILRAPSDTPSSVAACTLSVAAVLHLLRDRDYYLLYFRTIPCFYSFVYSLPHFHTSIFISLSILHHRTLPYPASSTWTGFHLDWLNTQHHQHGSEDVDGDR